eukprot:3372141-Rhodomonas_salina.2
MSDRISHWIAGGRKIPACVGEGIVIFGSHIANWPHIVSQTPFNPPCCSLCASVLTAPGIGQFRTERAPSGLRKEVSRSRLFPLRMYS